MADSILGIAGSIDISDIQKSFDELIGKLTKLGVTTDEMSDRMNKALKDIGASSADMATKQKMAMEVYRKGIEDAKNAIQSMPQAIKQANDETEKYRQACDNLRQELSKSMGTDAFDAVNNKLKENQQLLTEAEGRARILSKRYDEVVTFISQASSSIDSFNSISSVATGATTANAIAHGAAAVAVGAEAAQHGQNAQKIGEETQAVSENTAKKTESAETVRQNISMLQQEAQLIDAVTQKVLDNTAAENEAANTLTYAKDRIATLKEEYNKLGQEVDKARETFENTPSPVINGKIDNTEAEKAYEKYEALRQLYIQMGADINVLSESYKRLQEAQNASSSTGTESMKETEEATKRTTQAVNEEAKAHVEAKSKIEEAYEAQKKKVEELLDQYNALKQKREEALTITTIGGNALMVPSAAVQMGATFGSEQLKNAREYGKELEVIKEKIREAYAEEVRLQEAMEKGVKDDPFGVITQSASQLKERIKDVETTLSGLQKEYDKLSKGDITEGKEEKLRKLSDAIRSHKDELSACQQRLTEITPAYQKVIGKVGEYWDKLKDVATGHGKFQEGISKMSGAFGSMGLPLQGAITGVKEFNAGLWTLCKNPIGAIIAAVVLAVQALTMWFRKSADGQKAFAQVSAFVGSIMSSLTDILVKVGRYLFHAFADAQGPMNGFAQGLVTTLKSAVKTASDLLSGLGDMVRGVVASFNGDFSAAWEYIKSGGSKIGSGLKSGLETIGNAFTTTIKGVGGALEMTGKGAKDIFGSNIEESMKSMIDKARESANLAKQEAENNLAIAQAKKTSAELEKQIAVNREKIYTLTGKEKDALIEETKQLEKQKYDDLIKTQQKQYDIQKQRNSLHEVTLDDLAKERELELQIIKTETQREASTRMLTRMQEANRRSMESAAKQSSKKDAQTEANVNKATAQLGETTYQNAEAREKAVRDLEKRIADAQIAAMSEGAEKVLAERKRQYKQELDAIVEQQKAAVEAERKRQKAEYNATQAIIKAQGGKVVEWDNKMFDDKTPELQKILGKYAELYAQTIKKQENEEKEYVKNIVAAHQSYTDKKAAIDKKYEEDVKTINQAIVDAQKRGDEESVESLKRSLAEAAKERAKSQAQLSLEQLKISPEYIRAFEDLGNTSSETLDILVKQFEAAKEAAAESMNPEDLREYTQTLEQMYDELNSRDPFKAIKDSAKEMREAHNEVLEAEDQLNRVRKGESIPISAQLNKETGLLEIVYLSEEKAVKKVAAAKDKETRATNKHRKATLEAKKSIDNLAASIQDVGNAMGGTAGQVLGMIGDIMTFATSCMEAITFESKATSAALQAVEKASVILAIVGAAIQLLQTISSLFKDAHSQYEEYAAKVSEVEKLRQKVEDYRLELLKAQQAEAKWFGSTGLQDMSDQWQASAKAIEEYAKTAAAAQAIYENESGGGWLTNALSWLGSAVGWLVSLPGNLIMGALDGLGIINKDSFLGQLLNYNFTAMFGGAEGVIGKVVGELIKAQDYAEGTTAAINNLRIETREASSGFLGTGIGGHSQETQDLQSWVKENYGKDLFDANGVIQDLTLAKEILEKHGDSLVGETKETLERLIELKEEYDKFQETLRDYISGLYSPLADNLADAIWDWYAEGKDVMDSFRDYAKDTFEAIGKEMLKQLIYSLVFDKYKEDLQTLYTAYSVAVGMGANEADALANLSNGISGATAAFVTNTENSIPALQLMIQAWGEGMEKIGISFHDTEDEVSQSFDNIRSAFSNLLSGTATDMEEWAKNVRKVILQEMLEKTLLGDAFNEWSKQWGERYVALLNEFNNGTISQQMFDSTLQSLIYEFDSKATDISEAGKRMMEALGFEDAAANISNSLDNLANTFLSSLLNMEDTAEEMGKNIASTLIREMLEQMLASEKYASKMNAIREKWQKILNGENVDAMGNVLFTMEDVLNDIANLNNEIASDSDISSLAEQWKELNKEVEEAQKPFENLRQTFLSTLMDMDADAEDWAENVGQMMAREIIEEMVSSKIIQPLLDELTDKFNSLMETEGATVASVLAELTPEIEKMKGAFGDARPIVEQILNSFGLIKDEIADTTFTELTDSWISTLMDMEATAEDWAESIGQTMARRIIEEMIAPTMLQPYLDAIQTAFNNAIAGGNVQDAITAVLPEIEKMKGAFGDIQPIVRSILDALGLIKDEVEEIEEEADTTFKDLSSSWIATLMDMEATADDWAQSVGRTMAQRIIEEMIAAKMIQPLLDQLQSAFDSAISAPGATWQSAVAAMTPYITQLKDAFNELRPIVDQILNTFGIFKEEVVEEAKDGFGDLRSAFVSSLMDMEADAEQFGRDIARKMTEQMVDRIIEKGFQSQIDALAEEWYNALESGDTSAMETIRQNVIELQKLCGEAVQPLLDNLSQIEYVEEVIEEEIDETITSMRDSFLSALMDMTAGTQSFVNDLKKILTQKIVEKFVLGQQFETWLNGIQSQYDAIYNSGMSEKQMAEAMNRLATEWELKAREMQDQTQRIFDLTGWSKVLEQMNSPLSDLRSQFLSTLMDIESDTQDFADDIASMLTEAFIDKFVLGDEFDKRLAEWQERYASIMGGGYSEEERAALLRELQLAITAAKEGYAQEAQAIHDLMGTTKAATQDATMNMADKATYDQFETFLGIAVAQQMATLQGNEVRIQILTTLQTMTGITTPNNDTVKAIRTMLATTNEYLLDIKRSNRLILEQFGITLEAIKEQLSKIY